MTQTLLCGKWLITVITSIWFFSCMSSNMITQHLLCAKRLTTVVTSICFLTCISSNMLTQTLLCGKWLITVVTVGRSPSVSLPESLLHMYLTQESWHAGLRPLWSWLLIPYFLFNYLFKLVAFRPKIILLIIYLSFVFMRGFQNKFSADSTIRDTRLTGILFAGKLWKFISVLSICIATTSI